MPSASLHEIYESIDGEGFHAGQPVIIVRFAGCNLSCSYCDTPQARQATDLVQVSTPSGEIRLRNPIDVGEIVSLLAERFSHRTVLLTGGEPLLQAEAAVALGLALRLRGFAVHLESNGTLLPEKRLATAAFESGRASALAGTRAFSRSIEWGSDGSQDSLRQGSSGRGHASPQPRS
mgnify:CR=1 FL=1